MNITRIKAAAIKALMAVEPQFYAWSAQRQQTFRATLDSATKMRIDSLLLQALFGLICTPENLRDTLDDLPSSQRNDFNWASLLTTGIGDDMILLNESMAEGVSLLDFETLYDYDFDDHLFQERERQADQRRDYYAVRSSLWARLIIEDRFYYATFYSVASYLKENLEDAGYELIENLIPYEFIEGPDHNKPVKEGFIWNMKIDANGLEKHLDQLKSRWYDYIWQRWIALSQEYLEAAPAVFVEEDSDEDENHRKFIFSNEHALRRVRWQLFLADCQAINMDFAPVAEKWAQELDAAKIWLQQTCEDILKNYDPKIVPLKQKRKVIVALKAFDELFGDNDEDQ